MQCHECSIQLTRIHVPNTNHETYTCKGPDFPDPRAAGTREHDRRVCLWQGGKRVGSPPLQQHIHLFGPAGPMNPCRKAAGQEKQQSRRDLQQHDSPVICPFRLRPVRGTVIIVRPHLCLLRLLNLHVEHCTNCVSAAAAPVTECQTEQNLIRIGTARRARQHSVTAYDPTHGVIKKCKNKPNTRTRQLISHKRFQTSVNTCVPSPNSCGSF